METALLQGDVGAAFGRLSNDGCGRAILQSMDSTNLLQKTLKEVSFKAHLYMHNQCDLTTPLFQTIKDVNLVTDHKELPRTAERQYSCQPSPLV